MIDFNCVCHLFSSSGMYTPKHSPLTPQPTRQQWEGDSVLWWPSSISEKQKAALSEISIPDGGDVCYTGEKISEGSALSKRLEGSRLLELGWEVSYQTRVLAARGRTSAALHTSKACFIYQAQIPGQGVG